MSLVRFRPEAPSSPSVTLLGKQNASVAHLVERHLAKVEVASSSLVTRSKFFGALCGSIWCHSQVVRQSSAKAPLPSSNLGGTSRKRHDFCRVFLLFAPVLSQKLGSGDEPGPFIMQKTVESQRKSLKLNGFSFGGDGGIRTHGPLRIKRFRVS